jgi:hypothetical protein
MWWTGITYVLPSLFETATAAKRGRTTKGVLCEQCGHRYAYELRRTGRGSVSAPFGLLGGGFDIASAQASAQAAEDLSRMLAQDVDVVPCPACGRCQKDMVPEARSRYLSLLLNVGACLTLGLVPFWVLLYVASANITVDRQFFGLTTSGYAIILACLTVLGIRLLIGGPFLASRYDPNAQDVETRKKRGQARAIFSDRLQ